MQQLNCCGSVFFISPSGITFPLGTVIPTIYGVTVMKFNINSAYGHGTHVYDDAEIRRYAPSVFTTVSHNRTSSRYVSVPTIDVVNTLRDHNWVVTKVLESGVRNPSRIGFSRHMVRFRRSHELEKNGTAIVGDTVPELVLLNAHDGSSSYTMHLGLYRYSCSNGMIVADSTVEKQSYRHTGDVIDHVIEGTYRIIEGIPETLDRIEQFRSTQLNTHEALLFGKAAIPLRWKADEQTGIYPVSCDQVISVNRDADQPNNLWTILNRAQENILRGGMATRARNKRTGKLDRGRDARAILSVSENVRLNKALWVLADEFDKLKAAA